MHWESQTVGEKTVNAFAFHNNSNNKSHQIDKITPVYVFVRISICKYKWSGEKREGKGLKNR